MTGPEPPLTPPGPRRFERDGPGIEFGRLVNFTDAIFAIAMTLLVVEVGIPVVRDETSVHDLARALEDKLPGLTAFVIGFLVIGFYWVAHHQFMARIAAVDGPFIALTVVYLLFIAFLPFPTGLLGEYFENPLAVAVFAVSAAAVSAMEAALFACAHRRGLSEKPLPNDIFRYGLGASLLPVAFFVASIPVAWIATWLAVLVWALSVPAQAVWGLRAPSDAADYDV
jgi:uncharacterized membrane protein